MAMLLFRDFRFAFRVLASRPVLALVAALSYPEYLDLKRANTLREVVAIGGRGAMLVDGQSRELHTLNLVSSNFFTAMDVKPALGRLRSV
jgi:hypothetical protein